MAACSGMTMRRWSGARCNVPSRSRAWGSAAAIASPRWPGTRTSTSRPTSPFPPSAPVLHTLNPRLHASELSYIIEHAGDRAIVVEGNLLPLLEQLSLPRTVEHIIVMGDSAGRPAASLDYDELVAGGDASAFVEIDLDEREAAAMCYTSGTTGRPKGIVYSHRALALQALNLTTADSLAVSGRDVILAVVPMFHINGWGLPFAAALAGARLVLPGPRLDAESLLHLIASERVTLSGGVPTIWMAVLHALDARRPAADIRSLRALAVGGSAVPQAMLRGYKERHGVDVVQAWGMTETASIATVSTLPASLRDAPAEARYARLAKQGTPLPFVEIRARGEHGLVPWDGEALGELEIRGPMVSSQYLRRAHGGAMSDRGRLVPHGRHRHHLAWRVRRAPRPRQGS